MEKRQGKKAAAPDGPAVYTVPLELGGRTLTLEFNFGAYMAMFEYTGVDVLGEWSLSALGPRGIVCLLLSATVTHHQDVDYDWCAKQMRGRDYGRVMEAVLDAYRRSMPDPPPESAENPTPPVM